jgi:DNA-directed RNA polymerase specialized sigma24 family protein
MLVQRTWCMPSDEELLSATARGDDEAFAVFDLAAETFAVVALGPGEFRGEGAATAWLYGVPHHNTTIGRYAFTIP